MLDTKNPIYRITVMGEEIPIVPSDFVIPEPTPPTPEEPDTDYDQNYRTIIHSLSTPVPENGWASSAAVVEAISAVFDENLFQSGYNSGTNPINSILEQWQNNDKNTFESLGFVLETFRHQTNVTLEDGTTRLVNIYDEKDLTTPLTVRNVGYVLNGQIVDYETLYNRSDWVMFLYTTVVIKNTGNTVDIYLYIYALESGVYTSADGLITLNLDNDVNTSTTNFSNMNEYAGQVFSFSLYLGMIFDLETDEEYLGASAYVYDNNLGSLEFKFKLTGFNQLSYKGTPLTKTGDLQVAEPVSFSWDVDSSKFAFYRVTDQQTGNEVSSVIPGRSYNVYFSTQAGFYTKSLTIDGVQQAFWDDNGVSSTTVSFIAPSNDFTIGLHLAVVTYSWDIEDSSKFVSYYIRNPNTGSEISELTPGENYYLCFETQQDYFVESFTIDGVQQAFWDNGCQGNTTHSFVAPSNNFVIGLHLSDSVAFSWGYISGNQIGRWEVRDPETGNQVYQHAALTPGKTYEIVLMSMPVNGYFLEAVTINGVQQAYWKEGAVDATISFTAPSDNFTIEVQVATRNTFTYNAENFSTFELHESYIDTEMGGGTSYRLFADSNFNNTALTVGKEYAIKMAPNSSVAITEVYYNDTLLWSGMHNDLGVELLITFVATTNGTFRVVTQLTPTTTTNTFNYTQADLSDIELHEPYEEEPGSWSHLAEGAALNSTQLTIGTEYRMMLIANTNSAITQVSYNGDVLWSGTHTNGDGNLFVTFNAVENGVLEVTTILTNYKVINFELSNIQSVQVKLYDSDTDDTYSLDINNPVFIYTDDMVADKNINVVAVAHTGYGINVFTVNGISTDTCGGNYASREITEQFTGDNDIVTISAIEFTENTFTATNASIASNYIDGLGGFVTGTQTAQVCPGLTYNLEIQADEGYTISEALYNGTPLDFAYSVPDMSFVSVKIPVVENGVFEVTAVAATPTTYTPQVTTSNCNYIFTDSEGNDVAQFDYETMESTINLTEGETYTLYIIPVPGYGNHVITFNGTTVSSPYTFTVEEQPVISITSEQLGTTEISINFDSGVSSAYLDHMHYTGRPMGASAMSPYYQHTNYFVVANLNEGYEVVSITDNYGNTYSIDSPINTGDHTNIVLTVTTQPTT